MPILATLDVQNLLNLISVARVSASGVKAEGLSVEKEILDIPESVTWVYEVMLPRPDTCKVGVLWTSGGL